MKQPLRERVTGIDLLEDILSQLNRTGQSIYLLGSKPGISERAAEEMIKQYPNLKIAGTYHGYFTKDEETEIIEQINRVSPDCLCVALGSPKQERFIYKYRGLLKTKVAIGVGGSLDVWAGELKRAPDFYRKFGLEWLYRLIQQPSRYKRMAALPVFMIKIILKR
jgi:N-acetylglucosaminyldiphosphoundecaprenol N-acetyl-beta-D-mannosaminyltransferase